MRILRVIYVLAIAVALVLLVVAGVEAFYPAPSYPDYDPPTWDYNSTEYQEWEQEWQEAYAIYQDEAQAHDRNIFFVVLPLGAVFAVVGTFIQRRTGIFAAGLILGGVATMIFAVVPYGLGSIPRFIGVAVILAVLIFVGYKVFISLRKS
jgi:lipopolysaccharide export LptBFGC system permease protein LptF